MTSHLISTYAIEDLLEEIEEHLQGGFNPTLAFVYASPAYDIRKLVAELSRYPFLIFGSTTAGEITADDDLGVDEKDETIACMLVDLPADAMSLKLFSAESDDYYAIGEQVGRWCKSQFDDVSVITVTAGLTFDNDGYTQGILSTGITYVFGGAAGDDLILKDTFVFSGKNFTNHGMIVLALDNTKIDIVGSRAFGWTGIGKERIVTRADKNIVYEIDNEPAIDFYKNYLHVESVSMPQTGIEYPLEVQMRNGQVVYRAVLDINEENGSLVFAGHVEEKSKVRISAPEGKAIIDHVDRSIRQAIEERGGFDAQIGLLFPCCSRKQVLGALTRREIEVAFEAAQCPLIGFYAYGEIGAFPGGYGFHNETFVTALLREKD